MIKSMWRIMACLIIVLSSLFQANAGNNIPEGFMDVTTLGVNGDGQFDNTKILKTITKRHKKLFFPIGVYLFDTWFISHNDVSIRGEGMTQTKLVSTGRKNDHTIVLHGSGIQVSDLTVDGSGNKMRKPNRGDGASCLNITRQTRQTKITRVKFENSFNKQLIVLGSNVLINQCLFEGDKSIVRNIDGVHLYGGTGVVSNVEIRGSRFENLTRSGVYSDVMVNNIKVIDCTFDNSEKEYGGTFGVTIQGGGDKFFIEKNRFRNLSRGVVLRSGASNISIINNNFEGIYANAIMLTASERIHRLVSREALFNKTNSATQAINSGDYNLGFSTIEIMNNMASFSKLGSRIIEGNTTSFLLLIGAGRTGLKTLFSNINVKNCVVSSSAIPLKGFVYINMDNGDLLKDISLEENQFSCSPVFFLGTSEKRVNRLSIK